MSDWRKIKLSEVLKHRKEFITIEDSIEYKRCRVQVYRRGVVLRDIVKGLEINTKKQQVCRSGDFLVAEIDAKVGGYGFVPAELNGAIVSSHYFLFEIDKKKMLPDFLRVIIKTDIIQNQINAKGSTNYSAIRPKNVMDFEIPFIDIGEQKTIIDRVLNTEENFFSILSELTTQQTLITQLRQSILQEAVQGKLVKQNKNDEPASELLKRIKAEKDLPAVASAKAGKLIKQGKLKKEKPLSPIVENEIPFSLPKGWIWCRLNEIVELITKGSSPKWQGVNYVDPGKGILFVTSENVGSYKLIWENKKYVQKEFNEIEPRSILKKEDFLMNIVGASIGRTAVYNLNEVANINQAVCLIRLGHNLMNKIFLLNFFNSPVCVSYMFDKQVDMARPNLSMGNIAKFLIPLPPLPEQKRIVEKVNQLMQHCNELEQQVQQSIAHAQQLMQAVLREVFEGGKEKNKIESEKLSIAIEK